MSIDAPEFAEPISVPGAESMFNAPDHTKSRTVPPGIKRAIGKMGTNKKPRGGPRQLNAEDINRLEEYYDALAWAMDMYKPAVANAIRDEVERGEGDDVYSVTRARVCAEAWGDLAKENDSVRRLILMMVETGVWSKVVMVNLPILVAALPDDALSRLMFRFMPNPRDNSEEETLVNVA